MQRSTYHRVIIGDARKMPELPDESIHLVVTSPPYWQLKDYGDKRQIGFNESYEAYIKNLNLVWQECYRVLHKGCRLCINIGDQFTSAASYGRHKVVPIHAEIIKSCEALGMDYMGAIIWQKIPSMNRPRGGIIMGSFPYPRNGIVKLAYEYILIFRKCGKAPAVSQDVKEVSKLTAKEWNTYFAGHWHFNGAKQEEHPAVFPDELPRRLIRMFSFVGDTVLDPFLGSGTTTLAAKALGRNSVGYELNPAYIPIMKAKLKVNQQEMFHETVFEFTERKDRKEHDASC